MRAGASWQDVCILNQSLHGLGIQAAEPPERGTYVEIRRGQHVIVARIAWKKGHRAGIRSQDPIFLQALLVDAAAPARDPAHDCRVERRSAPRSSAEAHARSRRMARAFELVSVGLVGLVLAVSAFGMVEQALARPLQHIRMALD
jgi:hypothetical protein